MDGAKKLDKEFEDFKDYVMKWLTRDPVHMASPGGKIDVDLMGKRVDMILDVLQKEEMDRKKSMAGGD